MKYILFTFNNDDLRADFERALTESGREEECCKVGDAFGVAVPDDADDAESVDEVEMMLHSFGFRRGWHYVINTSK